MGRTTAIAFTVTGKGVKADIVKAIARAIVNDPPILILDESTSGLDPISEESQLKLQGSLDNLLQLDGQHLNFLKS